MTLSSQPISSRVDAVPADPPDEVWSAMRIAAATFDRLAASGRCLHFDLEAPGGRLRVAVTDTSGTVLNTISSAQALRIAAGQTPS